LPKIGQIYNFSCGLCTCRKILSDLSSDSPVVSKIEEEKGEEEGTTTINNVPIPTPIYQTTGGQYSRF